MSTYFGPDIVVKAYKDGFFPMAESREGEIYWHSPDPRAVFPLYDIKMPRSMKQYLKKRDFVFSVNTSFDKVIKACADKYETWISQDIIDTYSYLHRMGFVHSVETWEKGELVGGLYGASIGGAFFGESMFSDVSNSSKAAFYYLVQRLIERDFILLDSQYINHFTRQLGAVEISRRLYMQLLREAVSLDCKFDEY